MLRQLYIKNFTLIDELNIKFESGFSVITGETGAGKSIILGAIALLLGQRADSKTIKTGTSRCIIEAHFNLIKYDLSSFFVDNDIEYDAEDCILRRELTSAGKSRAFINDTPVSLQQLRQLGQHLVDIHSQHQNLLLQEEDFQLNVVDVIAENQEQRRLNRLAFERYSDVKKQLEKLRKDIEKAHENEDFLRFQYNELKEAELEPGIQTQLEQESKTLSHVEEIKKNLFTVENIFYGNDSDGIVGRLKDASRALNNIKDVYPNILDANERLESCYIELKDLAQEISNTTEHIDFDPRRQEEIDQRLDCIYTLEKKHHKESVEELIELRDILQKQLQNLDNSDEQLDELEQELRLRENECLKTAEQLSETRRKAAKKIEKEMLKKLIPLDIPHVRFEINMERKKIQADGYDRVCFMFSANTSSPMQPVSSVASGGEIARVMLSLKAMISGTVKLPTIIFDEIDTGVSGKIAEQMAYIMKEMGECDRQVISITHLPQIAALGRHHYKVFKEETPDGTRSHMNQLTPDERVKEIAQMLSGSDVSEAAINNAKALLKTSMEDK